jgi:hypothetical protein
MTVTASVSLSTLVDADLIADQLRRMYLRLAQDIEVTAVQPTGLTCSSDAIAVLL